MIARAGEGIGAIVADATELVNTAREELAREADALKQKFQALRTQLSGQPSNAD